MYLPSFLFLLVGVVAEFPDDYEHMKVLVPDMYTVHWKVVGDEMLLALQVETTGWVAFGLGDPAGGSMGGADIVVAFPGKDDEETTVNDLYALGKSYPLKDTCADWELMAATKTASNQVIELKRKLDTGDAQDRPFILIDNDVRSSLTVIVAWGTAGTTTFGYHSANRQSTRVNFHQPDLADPLLALKTDSEVKNFTIRALQPIVSAETLYHKTLKGVHPAPISSSRRLIDEGEGAVSVCYNYEDLQQNKTINTTINGEFVQESCSDYNTRCTNSSLPCGDLTTLQALSAYTPCCGEAVPVPPCSLKAKGDNLTTSGTFQAITGSPVPLTTGKAAPTDGLSCRGGIDCYYLSKDELAPEAGEFTSLEEKIPMSADTSPSTGWFCPDQLDDCSACCLDIVHNGGCNADNSVVGQCAPCVDYCAVIVDVVCKTDPNFACPVIDTLLVAYPTLQLQSLKEGEKYALCEAFRTNFGCKKLAASKNKTGAYELFCESVEKTGAEVLFEIQADPNKEYHMLGFEHLITVGKEKKVHHITMSGNAADGTNTFIWAWALGGQPFAYPKECGMKLGGADGFISLQMTMHYDNPDGTEVGELDASGIRIFYSEKLRENECGVVALGDAVQALNFMKPPESNIPKGVSKFVTHCSADCTQKLFPNGATIFSSFLHMHQVGRRIWTEHSQNGTNTVRQWNDFWDHNFEITVPKDYKVQAGDSLKTTCVYVTQKEGLVWGLQSSEEMCVDFIYYWPRVSPIFFCGVNPFGDSRDQWCGSHEKIELVPGAEEAAYFGKSSTCATANATADPRASSADASTPVFFYSALLAMCVLTGGI